MKGSGWEILRKIFHIRIKPVTLEVLPELQMKRPYLLRNELEKETRKALDYARLEEVRLDTLPLQMDFIYRRVLRLLVDSTKLKLPSDYRLVTPIKVHPEMVAIAGPKRMLKALPNPYLLDMSDVKITEKNFLRTFQITIRSIPRYLLTQDEEKVTISFKAERFLQKTVITTFQANTPRTRDIQVQLNYLVRESLANQVQDKEFVVEGDWSEYKKADGTIAVNLVSCPRQVNPNDVTYIKRIKIE